MLRFLHVLIINAWRGMRRAKATPAILLTLVAVSVLFVGGNASARSSIQSAMHVVGLPVNAPSQPDEQISDAAGSNNGSKPADPHKHKTDDSKHGANGAASTNTKNASVNQDGGAFAASAANAEVSLIPPTITPVCQQGVMLYNVPAAQLTFAQPVSGSGTVTWSWETRIDSGANAGSAPISSAAHTVTVTSGQAAVPIIPDDTTQQLVSAAANTNYAYSFRLDITSPFTASSAWVSVPQADSSTCP